MDKENLPIAIKIPVPIVDGVLAPTDFDGLWRCISVICETSMAGNYKKKPEEAFVAAQLGMSVGMNYMQSLQSVAVIKGKPSLYGDATTALCKASGGMEDHQEFWELDGKKMEDYDGDLDLAKWPDGLKAVCVMKRKGVKTAQIGKFSIADAKRMQKWNKHTNEGNLSVWQKHPKDMLMWKARHRAQSTAFADVLKGFLPAAIAADYDATVLEETAPGVYSETEKANSPSPEKANESPVTTEKKQVAKEMQFLINMAEENKLPVARLEEFVGVIAKENNTTLAGLIPDIQSRQKEFISMFEQWDNATGSYVGQPDPDPSGESMDHKPDSGPDSSESEPQTTADPESDPIVLRQVIDLAFDKYVEENSEAFYDSDTESNLSAYINYCAEMTKRTVVEAMQLAKANPESFFQYFFSWMEMREPAPNGTYDNADQEKKAVDERTASEIPPAEEKVNAISKPEGEKIDPPGETKEPEVVSKPEVPEVIKNATKTKTYTPFVLEFKNMTAPRYTAWVKENKERLEAADSEDFKDAVRKWEKLRGEGKIKDEWPYPQQQAKIEFSQNGMINARQRIANLKQTNPTEVEVARKKLGFASTVSEEAAAIWEKMVHEIIEDRAKKAARKRK